MDPGRSTRIRKRVSHPQYQLGRLSNGLRLATVEMPHMQSACVGIWAHIGGRHESAAQSGISHFLEHMIFKGTERFSPKQISASIEGVGGYINAFTSEDSTCYYAKATADQMGRLIDVLLDIYTGSTFDPTEVERERQVIREEIAMYRDQPCQHVQELLTARMWPDNGLGRPLTGTHESIERIGRDDIAAFCRRWYNSAATTLAVASPLPHQEVVAMAEQYTVPLPKGRKPSFHPIHSQVDTNPHVVANDVEQCHVAIGFESFGRRDARRYALKLLSVVLGENMSSRLFQELRECRGYCYSVCSTTSLFEEVGMLNISLGLDATNLNAASKVLFRELRRIRDKRIPPRELDRAKDYVIGHNLLGLESTTNQMMWIGESVVGYGGIKCPEEVRAKMAEVTDDEIQAVASEVMQGCNLGVAIIGPETDCPDYQQLLG